MSSTFFILPLANRISEPLVKFDVLAAGGDSGSGVLRRSFFGEGSATAPIWLLLLLLMLVLWLTAGAVATVVAGWGGGSIRCCCSCKGGLLSLPFGTLNCSGGDDDGLARLPTLTPPFLFGGLGYLRSCGGCIRWCLVSRGMTGAYGLVYTPYGAGGWCMVWYGWYGAALT